MSTGRLTIDDYLAALASDAPAPGGGAVAALTAAQAAALLEMVIRISHRGHAGGNDHEPPAPAMDLTDRRRRLVELADEDGAAFGSVMRAYRLPAGTPAEKTARRAAIQESLKAAAQPPLAVLGIVGELHELAAASLEGAKPAIVSDAAVALHLLGAALRAAVCNVRVNLAGVKDATWVGETEEQLARLTKGRKKLRRRLLERIDALAGA